jgi:hypothetical protein
VVAGARHILRALDQPRPRSVLDILPHRL